MHADMTQQIFLVSSAVKALGTCEFLFPIIVSLEVPLDVAAHSGLVWAVWTRVWLFSCVLSQVNL